MGTWCHFRADDDSPKRTAYSYYPRCGTVACEAGWIGLRSGVEVADGLPSIADQRVGWEDMADIIAGFSEAARTELRHSFLVGEHFDTRDGTREQAEATAKFLKGFKRKWQRELKARIILPGGMVQSSE